MQQNKNIVFTILLPVHRDINLLPFSVESVLSQTVKAFELFIICDGVPVEISECANNFAKQDSRVRVFNFPKGKRFGEAYRHHALMQANGQFVAGIGDDDLWFPNHLEEMEKLLCDVDFGNLFQTEIKSDGKFSGVPADLGDAKFINKMLNHKFNFFGPSACGYRLSAYRKLREGWSPAPKDIWVDLYMWRKFLSTKGLKFGSRFAITSLHFSSELRKTISAKDREKELRNWALKIKSPLERDRISQQVLKICVQRTNRFYLLNRFSRMIARLLFQ